MIRLSSFSILTSGSFLLVILFILILAVFSYFVYKYSIPKVSLGLRTFLMILRSLIFILILFLIFEPVLSLIQKDIVESKTYVYIDNSNSIASKDSLKKLEQTISLINDLNSTNGIKTKFYTFGKKIDSLEVEQSEKINFREPQTNFASIIENIKQNSSQINSAVILSDGIITDGIDPTYQAEKLHIPIFTIGVGDSALKKDIQIYNVLYNQVIYSDRLTTIEVAVKSYGFENRNTRVSFFEENKFIETKDLILSETGLNKIQFSYKPSSNGEKKLTVSISPLEGEASTKNNSRVFYLNVLDTKLQVCLIAGSPSADVSAIANALSTDKNIQLKKLIQISQNKFWKDVNPNVIDSADLLFLVDFPSDNTPQNLIERIFSTVNRNKPFFFLLSSGVSLNRLSTFEKVLPFSFSSSISEFIQVQPDLNSESFSSYFSTSSNKKEIWNNLPYVTQFSTELSAKPGSNVLVSSKIKNIQIGNPLIVSKNIGDQRVLTILAGDIWRWQLQTAERNPEFFDNLMNDIVKWLNVSSQQKQFRISTDRKNYSPGEGIELKAELYDNTFSPVDTAKISLQLFFNSKTIEQNFAPVGNGIYTSLFVPSESGDFSFEGTARLNGSILKSEKGRFNVGGIQIERLDARMRVEFLKLLSNSTNGDYFSFDDYSGLKEILIKLNQYPSKEISNKSDYQLWTNEWILFLIISLFALEWFIRKRTGMI